LGIYQRASFGKTIIDAKIKNRREELALENVLSLFPICRTSSCVLLWKEWWTSTNLLVDEVAI